MNAPPVRRGTVGQARVGRCPGGTTIGVTPIGLNREPDRSKKKSGPPKRAAVLCLNQSAPGGIRTPNLLIRSQMLYPLSYGRMPRYTRGARNDEQLYMPSTVSANREVPRNPAVDGCDAPTARPMRPPLVTHCEE